MGGHTLPVDSPVEKQHLLFRQFLKLHEWLSGHFSLTPQPHHAMTWYMPQKNQGSVACLHLWQAPWPPTATVSSSVQQHAPRRFGGCMKEGSSFFRGGNGGCEK